ncbi:MAG: class I SAM-dependent methyltransferase [Candidatus Bathyarchaeota archaeon]|nr:class I SAM-dependent methyltransferase [Candidatus Bathyarchaeota archaeon]
MEIYRHPLYYEVAFGFVDAKKQVDSFERIIEKFSKIKVKRFLDIACGPSLQLREIAKRGYEAVGLDLSTEMLAYLRQKAKEERIKIETVKADMCKFKLAKAADFAFIMMGSLEVESNERFLSHLDSVAGSLKKGGLYFIQNKVVDWTREEAQTWTMEREGIAVKTTFSTRWKDLLNQIYVEKCTMEVNEHGQVMKLESEEELKFIFPQEFKVLAKLSGKFEFLGWWKGNCDTWNLDQPICKENLSNDNMVLLRRK